MLCGLPTPLSGFDHRCWTPRTHSSPLFVFLACRVFIWRSRITFSSWTVFSSRSPLWMHLPRFWFKLKQLVHVIKCSKNIPRAPRNVSCCLFDRVVLVNLFLLVIFPFVSLFTLSDCCRTQGVSLSNLDIGQFRFLPAPTLSSPMEFHARSRSARHSALEVVRSRECQEHYTHVSARTRLMRR